MGYFGEGGGCFGVGRSKNVLCMHHHNVAYSSRCGKNMSRLVVPHGASVAGPEFARKAGSRSEPSGLVFAPMTMSAPPWDGMAGKALVCAADADLGDLGVHPSNHSCLSHVDIGLEYGWYPGANVAVWRGDTDKRCHICKLAGNSSSWPLTAAEGAAVYALRTAAGGDARPVGAETGAEGEDKGEEKGEEKGEDELRRRMRHFHRHVEKTRLLEGGHALPPPRSGLELGGGAEGYPPKYTLKSYNFGANWTWIELPPHLQGLTHYRADPSNGSVLYGIASGCIGRSFDGAESWEGGCWRPAGLDGSVIDLAIKDSRTMLAMRNGAVPLRTRDGGASWQPLDSVAPLARCSPGAEYSWSGRTLALSCILGKTVVWVSTDDGDTFVDESGDYTADNGGIAQWYDNQLFISSMGQGISAKVFEER